MPYWSFVIPLVIVLFLSLRNFFLPHIVQVHMLSSKDVDVWGPVVDEFNPSGMHLTDACGKN